MHTKIIVSAKNKYQDIRQMLGKHLPELFLFLLLIQPVLDITAFFTVEKMPVSISLVLRGCFLVITLVMTFFLTSNYKRFFTFYGIIGLFFCVHVLVALQNGYVNPYKDFEIFIKIAQMPMLTFAFIEFFRFKSEVSTSFQYGFTANLYVLCGSVLISMLTNSFANTYDYTESGVLGWFYNGNAQSAILVILVPVALSYVLTKKNAVWAVITTGLGFAYLFFIGTRTAYYAIFIIGITACILLLLTRKDKKVKSQLYIKLGALLLAMVICGISFPLSPMYQTRLEHNRNMQVKYEQLLNNNQEITSEQKEKLYETYCKELIDNFGYERVEKEYKGSVELGVLADVRLAKRTFAKLTFEDLNILTKLFGFEYEAFNAGNRIMEPENDLPTIFYLYGYVGFGLYIVFCSYFAWCALRYLWRVKQKFLQIELVLVLVGLALILASSIFAGHTLVRPSVSIYVSASIAFVYGWTSLRSLKIEKLS